MFVLIDIRAIIKKHYETLRSDAPIRFILLLFLFLPLLVAASLIYYDKLLNCTAVGNLTTAYTLFTGFLLSIIFLLFDAENKLEHDASNYDEKKLLLNHLYANTLYALFISIVTFVMLIAMTITGLGMDINNGVNLSLYIENGMPPQNTLPDYPLMVVSFIVYFLISHFIMTLLMILKRLYFIIYVPVI